MARMSEDDEAAFDAFVVQRRSALTRTAFLLTGDLHRAEDLVQAALLEVFRRWPRLRDQVDPVGYARRTVVTTHLNLVRRLSWREVPVASFPDDGGGASDGHDGTVQRLALRAALLRLPPRMRALLVLRYFDDLSEQDTAAALGCSQGTVKSTASRGLARLREVLDQHDLPAPGVAPPAPLPSPTPPGGRP